MKPISAHRHHRDLRRPQVIIPHPLQLKDQSTKEMPKDLTKNLTTQDYHPNRSEILLPIMAATRNFNSKPLPKGTVHFTTSPKAQLARKFKKVQAKKLVKSNQSIFFVKLTYLIPQSFFGLDFFKFSSSP